MAKFVPLVVVVVFVLVSCAFAQDFTVPPWHTDKAFLAAAAFDAGATALDGWMTVPRWNCEFEERAWLYGYHPGAKRVAGAMAAQYALDFGGALLLRRWRRKLNFAPFLGDGSGHVYGAIHNIRTCG